MKLISWNVNGLRACVKKGFEDFFKGRMQTFSVYRKQSFKKGRLTLHQKGMNVTGTMQRKKVTLAQPYLRRNTH